MQVAQKASEHSLDNFRKSVYAKRKGDGNTLSGWLHFLCTENADDAADLCQTYPWLTDIYLEMAKYRQNPKEVLSMFSAALREMDRNTVKYMVVKQQETIDELSKEIEDLRAEKDASLAEKDASLAEKDAEIARLREELSKKK